MKKILVVFGFLIVGCGVFFGYKTFFNGEEEPKESKKVEKKEVEKKLTIFNQDSNDRPIAVMINNIKAAWPHAGLDESYLNYEIIAEGGITRIMALFKGRENIPDKIGSVRSSRPYYLDYVLENDAIYVHWGGSDQAYSDMKSLKIDHIDGITYEGKYFFRDKTLNKSYEHTGFTKMSMIRDGIENLGIRDTSDKDLLFNYNTKGVDLSKFESAIKASEVEIVYSNSHKTNYEYDEVNKVYKRSMQGVEHVDAVTGKQYTAKNIITYQVKNNTLDSYKRQELENIGSGEGYYITEGYAVPITWEKTSRSAQTKYKYKSTGEEIELNDGNTWIQIQPKDKYLGITGSEETNEDIEENEE